MPFLTVKLVDDFAMHLKLFGLAIEHCEKQKEDGNSYFYHSRLSNVFETRVLGSSPMLAQLFVSGFMSSKSFLGVFLLLIFAKKKGERKQR